MAQDYLRNSLKRFKIIKEGQTEIYSKCNMSHDVRFPTTWYVRQAKAQISNRIIRTFASHLIFSMSVMLLIKQHL